ncbi:purine permease 3-like [Solanum pennellii]|uniref:Probable purine permease n=1 Tax=Solanum pennellii TaxID=28526 RepID=A0ABM1GLP1_SOLPN|nr:purine permease 3-like [Solanum pennellii]
MDNQSSKWRKFILVLNCITLGIGYCGGPLISRLYFLHGGQRIWLSSWLACIGWPIVLIVLIVAYFFRLKTQGSDTNFFCITRQEFTSSAALGILVGLAGYLYAWGPAKLPVSTSTVIYAAQLGFTVVFAFLIVKQKLTSYSVNAVVLLIVGAGTLALRAESDRPEGESTKQYVLGFVMTLLAAASTGLALPLLELIYIKAKKDVTYIMILEIQMILNIFASAFCTVGMIVNKDFQVISREAREFELGKAKYYLVLIWSAIIWQFSTLGIVGVVQYGSSLLCGILIALLLPLTELLGVVLYHETFQVTKGLAIFLSLWGFVSYFYGEMKQNHKKKREEEENPIPQTEMDQTDLSVI